jgi:hypothetical protein
MPAIDPERLKIQVDRLLEVVSDPVALQRGCIELLDFYADRTLKSVAIGEAEETYRAFGAPKPLMRALSFGLRSRLAKHPSSSFSAAAALWEAGYRETRTLASVILGELDGEDVPDWAESWALTCDDQIAMEELANQGLANWRKVNPTRFLGRVELWLGSTQKKLQSFALLALLSAVKDPSFEDLPTVFRLLDGTTGTFEGALFHLLSRLISALSRRSPPEAVRFLTDELVHGSEGTRRLIRNTKESFPNLQRDLLERALSVKNQTGIIRKP